MQVYLLNLKKSLSVIFAILALSHMSALVNAAEMPHEGFVQGKDFWLLPQNAEATLQLQSGADLEIFYWYGCQVCQQVEQKLRDYVNAHPELTVQRTPLVAFVSWRPQAYIQPMWEQWKESIPLPDQNTIYNQCITDCSVFSTFEDIKRWVKGQSQINELPTLDEAEIWKAEKNFRKRAESFSISQVPTIIVRGSYVVDANSAKTLDRMMTLVDYLLMRQ